MDLLNFPLPPPFLPCLLTFSFYFFFFFQRDVVRGFKELIVTVVVRMEMGLID